MSPEILLGHEFDLPTDIFSFGVILAEIAARRLADDTHFARSAPSFAIDAEEVRRLANTGCPPEFTQLAIECISVDPTKRPTTRVILDRLRAIEAEVLARPEDQEPHHTGSIKFMTGNARHTSAPRIPSFGQGIGEGIRISRSPEPYFSDDDDSDEELSDALSRLESVTVVDNGVLLTSGKHLLTFPLVSVLTADIANGSAESQQPLLTTESTRSDYSTTVIRRHSQEQTAPPLSSILTVRASPILHPPPPDRPLPAEPDSVDRSHELVASHHSAISAVSYFTASEEASIAAATEGGSSLQVHRFTLIRLGLTSKRLTSSTAGAGGKNPPTTTSSTAHGWSALDYFFFASGLLPGGGAKCDICTKRLGRKAVLECDDCGLRAHVKCGEMAPRDCGIRESPSLVRITSAPQPAAGPASGGGRAKARVQMVPASPFSHR